ncbi:hypothetical protein MMC25_006376 [Agyrium rufum]|nr:hypothetical protein [Agyrium rufum]
MASHPPQQCCTVGVRHEGTPTGKMIKIGNIETYVATPEGTTVGTILFLTDVLGHSFPNAQLMADQFAANKYLTVMPDLFDGSPIPLNRPPDFDMGAFRAKHEVANQLPKIAAVHEYMRKEMGVKKMGAVGYCWGGKYVAKGLNAADKEGGGLYAAGFTAHPSFISEEELSGIQGPLSIAAAETDAIFPPDKRHTSEAILKETGQHYQINLFSGVQHGFAVRADLSSPAAKFAKEQAFYQAIQWFDHHLKE